MEKKSFNKSMFLSVVTLLIALVLIPAQIVAWFAFSDKFNSDDLEFAVIGDTADGNLEIDFSTSGSGTEKLNDILPGEYSFAKLTLTNTTTDNKTYLLKLDTLGVVYPTSNPQFHYDRKTIQCADYYRNAIFADIENTITESIFKKFVAPASNALMYDLYYVAGNNFAPAYVPKYLSSAENATETELNNPKGTQVNTTQITIPISTLKRNVGDTVYPDNSVQVGSNAVINADGSVTLGSQISIILYLVFYFDPNFYSSANISQTPTPDILSLHNSNPFINQRLIVNLTVL